MKNDIFSEEPKITDVDYRLLGFYKVEEENMLGDIVKVEYYKNYDPNGDPKYTGLMVREEKVFNRDSLIGIPYSQEEVIKWYDGQGDTPDNVIYTKVFSKHYSPNKGFAINQESAKRLIRKASISLTMALGSADEAKELFRTFSNEVRDYHEGMDRKPLIEAITNHTDPRMTSEIKTMLLGILDVSYI